MQLPRIQLPSPHSASFIHARHRPSSQTPVQSAHPVSSTSPASPPSPLEKQPVFTVPMSTTMIIMCFMTRHIARFVPILLSHKNDRLVIFVAHRLHTSGPSCVSSGPSCVRCSGVSGQSTPMRAHGQESLRGARSPKTSPTLWRPVVPGLPPIPPAPPMPAEMLGAPMTSVSPSTA